MTHETFQKCKELNAELESLENFQTYLEAYEKQWWKLTSANDELSQIRSSQKGVIVPHSIRAEMLNITKATIAKLNKEISDL